jgi:hypothetical protein
MVTMAESMSQLDVPRPASPLLLHQEVVDTSTGSPLSSGLAAASHDKVMPSEHPYQSNRHHHQHSHHSHHNHPSSIPQKLKRVDTQDLKTKLATSLGNNGKRYWSALLDFMTAKIDRIEFEQEATLCLKPQHGESKQDDTPIASFLTQFSSSSLFMQSICTTL